MGNDLMGPHAIAWLVAVGCVPVALFALHRATRGWRAPRTKATIGALLAVWALLPAPVPGHPGFYAPAFLVFLFEWWFQRPGEPATSGIILAAGTLLAVGMGLLLAARRSRRD
jgi:hypothetical protein